MPCELKAGKLVTFSKGEYSDYSYDGTYVALKDVSEDEMQALAAKVRDDVESIGGYKWRADQHSMFSGGHDPRGMAARR